MGNTDGDINHSDNLVFVEDTLFRCSVWSNGDTIAEMNHMPVYILNQILYFRYEALLALLESYFAIVLRR